MNGGDDVKRGSKGREVRKRSKNVASLQERAVTSSVGRGNMSTTFLIFYYQY